MLFKLSISNPSDYPRGGYVTVPLQQDKIPQGEFIVKDWQKCPLTAQVDHIEPNDPASASLVFLLKEEIEAKATKDLTVEEGKPEGQEPDKAFVELLDNRGVKFVNNRLEAFLHLVPDPDKNRGKWYAGSIDSVLLDYQEILDPLPDPQLHDWEKRCMQVSQLQLYHPAWDTKLEQYDNLFDQPYQIVSKYNGPARASITLASEAFNYEFVNLAGQEQHLKYRLYRVISLYSDADYLIEELFVKRISDKNTSNTKSDSFYFTARYFLYMDLGHYPTIYQFPHIPDWFAVGALTPPYHGYGFATDVHASPIVWPHPEFPNQSRRHKSFSWQLAPCKAAKCLHLFMRKPPRGFDAEIGHHWYEHIYEPLRAEIHESG